MRLLMAVIVLMGVWVAVAGCTAPEQQTTGANNPTAAFLAAGELPADFRFEGIIPYPQPVGYVDTTVLPTPLGVDVAISMPSRFGEGGEFAITVDQRAVAFKEVGGGFGGGRSSHVFRVYPGDPGAKTITVTYANNGEVFSARQDYVFVSAGEVMLLEHFDGELLRAPVTLRVLSYFVTELKMTCNGTEVALIMPVTPVPPPLPGAPAGIMTCQPPLQPGRNECVLQWRDHAGVAQEKKVAFLYAPDGKIKVGDAVPLGFGYQGSRSGPFYQLAVADSTVASVTGDQSVARFPRVADGQLTFGTTLQQTVTGLVPGTTAIVVMKSRYFLFPFAPDDTITITVTP